MLLLCKHLDFGAPEEHSRCYQVSVADCHKYIVSLHVWAQWSKLTEDEKLKFNSSQDYATAYLCLIYASAHTAGEIEGERQIEKQNTLR